MGFMDKAKQAAKQAQQVLDEQQAKFNQSQNTPSQPSSGATYDQHGRPIQPAGAQAAAPDPAGDFAPVPPPGPGGAGQPPASGATGGDALASGQYPEAASAATAPVSDPTGDPAPPIEDPDAGAAPPPERPQRDDLNSTPDPFKPIGG